MEAILSLAAALKALTRKATSANTACCCYISSRIDTTAPLLQIKLITVNNNRTTECTAHCTHSVAFAEQTEGSSNNLLVITAGDNHDN